MDPPEKMGKKRSSVKIADDNYRAKMTNEFALLAKALGVNQKVKRVSKLDMLLQAKYYIQYFQGKLKKMPNPNGGNKTMLDEANSNFCKVLQNDPHFFRRTLSPMDVGSIFGNAEDLYENNKTGENNCTQPIMNDATTSRAQRVPPSNVSFTNCSEDRYSVPKMDAAVSEQIANEDIEIISITNVTGEENWTQPIANYVVISSDPGEPSTNLISFPNCGENGYTEPNMKTMASEQRATENKVIIPPYEGMKINPQNVVVGKRQNGASGIELPIYAELRLRKRGRPKTKVSPIRDTAVAPRKRGRPKKVAPIVDTALAPRKRGRPKTKVVPEVDTVTSRCPKTKIPPVAISEPDMENVVKRKRPKTKIGNSVIVKPPKRKIVQDRQNIKVVYPVHIQLEMEDAEPKEKLSTEVPDSAIINVGPRFPTPGKELNAKIRYPANVQLETEDVVPKERENLQTHLIASDLVMEQLMPKGLNIENVHPTYVNQNTTNVISKSCQSSKSIDANYITGQLEMEDAAENVGSVIKTIYPTYTKTQMKDEISRKRKGSATDFPYHTCDQQEAKEGAQKRLDSKVSHPAYITPNAGATMPNKKILETEYPAHVQQETIQNRTDVEASFDICVKPERVYVSSKRENLNDITMQMKEEISRKRKGYETDFPYHTYDQQEVKQSAQKRLDSKVLHSAYITPNAGATMLHKKILETEYPAHVQQETTQNRSDVEASLDTYLYVKPERVDISSKRENLNDIKTQMKEEISRKRKGSETDFPYHTYDQQEVKEDAQKRLDSKVSHSTYITPNAGATMLHKKILETEYPAHVQQETIQNRTDAEASFDICVKPEKVDVSSKRENLNDIAMQMKDEISRKRKGSETDFPYHTYNQQEVKEDAQKRLDSKVSHSTYITPNAGATMLHKKILETEYPAHVQQETIQNRTDVEASFDICVKPERVDVLSKRENLNDIKTQRKDEISRKRKGSETDFPYHTYDQQEVKEGAQKRLDSKVSHSAYITPNTGATMRNKKILETEYPAHVQQETIQNRSDAEASLDTYVKLEAVDIVPQMESSNMEIEFPTHIKPETKNTVPKRENLNTEVELSTHVQPKMADIVPKKENLNTNVEHMYIKTEIEDAVQERREWPGTQFITVKGTRNVEDKFKDLSNIYSTDERQRTKEITKSVISKGTFDDKENVDINKSYSSMLYSLFMNDSPDESSDTEDNAVACNKENTIKSEFSRMLECNGVNLQSFSGTDKFCDLNLLDASTSEITRVIEIEDDIQLLSSPVKSYKPSEIELIDLTSDDIEYLKVSLFENLSF